MVRRLGSTARGGRVWRPALALALVLGLLAAALGMPGPAAAATLVVNSGADGGGTCPGADCTLRQAIAVAAAGDTITFAGSVTAVILSTAQLTIDKSLTIDGGVGGVIVQRSTAGGTPSFGIITITAGNVAITRLTITGGDVAGNGGGVAVGGGTVTLTGATLSSNAATGRGGGLYVETGAGATVANTVINGNTAANGGGVAVQAGGSATLDRTTLSGNTATSVGGGGLLAFGNATVTNSTIRDNTAPLNGGGVNVQSNSISTLTNVTVSGNTSGGVAGGVANLGSLTLTGVTFVGNDGSGGDAVATAGTGTTLVATILTGADPCFGSVTDGGYNLETGATCGFAAGGTSLSNTDPQLGPLADNGGPTLTYLPAAGSPAADRIPPGGAACPATDQRGVARPQGAGCDIGAVERAGALVAPSGSAVYGGTTVTLTATVTGDGRPVAAGGAVTFTYNGQTYSATTDAQGVARAVAPLPAGTQVGTYPDAVGASYAGAGAYLGGSGTGPLVVAPPDCAARFSDVQNSDPACPAIFTLTGRGVIYGYATTPPTFGPDKPVQRAEVAAFLVRALGWQNRPQGPRSFSDFDGLAGDLRTASLIAANACDANGRCVATGPGGGIFEPGKSVTKAEVIAFIARAFGLDAKYAWADQPNGPQPYNGVPAVHETAIRTYTAYAGTIPDAPTTADEWNAPASRAWVARVLYQALQTKP